MRMIRVPTTLLLLASLVLGATGCASSGEDGVSEEDVTRLDAIDRPTDTRITLLSGRWHDNVLKPTEGWHAYHYNATEDGYVRVVMKAPVGHDKIWSYIRVEHVDPTGAKPWLHNTAGVGNTRTNLCEIIMKVKAGQKYKIITTSQHNLKATATSSKRHVSDGPYTIGVLPMDATLSVPE
jgi:hypothetical protein